MAGGGAQSGKRKSEKRAPGEKAQLIVTQINYCREQLVGFKTAYEIRKELAERWGLEERTANNRIKAAREAIRDDASQIDRQELASMMMDMATKVAEESISTRQMSNAIGAMRLLGELGGLTGQNKV
jgi:hypothetical protein